jgi:hypothetical protein
MLSCRRQPSHPEADRSGADLISASIDRRIGLAAAVLAGCLTVAAAQPQPVQQLHQDPPTSEPVPHADPPSAPAEDMPPPSGYRPGFIDALGRWLGDSKAAIDSQMRSTQERLGTLGSQARDAAGNVIAVPGSRVITGRQLCPPAANGAPDCEQGVVALCRTKGLQAGRSLDVTSSQRCPAKVWMSGRPPKDGECRLETYVTRAVCQ